MAKKIYLTDDKINTIITHSNGLRGTTEFTKYNMETYNRIVNDKKYTFIGWGIPSAPYANYNFYIQRGFIYQETPLGTTRYRLTENVKELLGL